MSTGVTSTRRRDREPIVLDPIIIRARAPEPSTEPEADRGAVDRTERARSTSDVEDAPRERSTRHVEGSDLSRAERMRVRSGRGTESDPIVLDPIVIRGRVPDARPRTGLREEKVIGAKQDAGAGAIEPGSRVPSPETLADRARTSLDAEGGRAMARDLEAMAPSFGVPAGGFSGQTNLYGGGGMPVAWYALRGALGTSADRTEPSSRACERLVGNLSRAEGVTDDPALTLAVTMREHPSAWTASSGRVETWSEGGLDFFGDHLDEMRERVPADARTGAWRRGDSFISPETGNEVHPATIPAADQLVAYGAELERAESHFEELVHEVYGDRADAVLASMSTDERRAWTQFTFGRPGRTHADDTEISSRSFSANAALELLHSEGSEDLGAILSDSRFEHNASIRRARTTAMEARWIDEHLLGE